MISCIFMINIKKPFTHLFLEGNQLTISTIQDKPYFFLFLILIFLLLAQSFFFFINKTIKFNFFL